MLSTVKDINYQLDDYYYYYHYYYSETLTLNIRHSLSRLKC